VASPFSVFRKNQKILMAVFGVAAMIAFVFLGPLSQYMGGGRPEGGNPVVVETKYGDLKASELQGLEYQRDLVNRFIEALVAESAAKQFSQPGMDNRWFQQIAQQQFMMWHNRIMEHASGGPEQQAVETMLMAERAKQMGLVVSDQTINDMIRQISSDSLSPAEIQTIISRLQPQRPISVARLFDAFRTELLAMQYYQFFVSSLADVPPAQRFEYFSRLNRRVKSELMPLAVAEFVSQAPEPTDAEVKEFYEKYKNAYPDPTSPEPGFNKPKRASFQYFKASLDPLAEQLKGEVTEEEIAKFYEENKQRFPAMSLTNPAAAAETPAAEPAADKPAEATPSEEKPAAEKPAEEQPAEAAPPAAEPPATATPAAPAEQPAEETPAAEPAPEEKPAEGEPAPSESPQARRAVGQVFRLVSLQEEKAAEEAPVAETPAEAPTTETPAEKPAGEAPATEAPAEAAPTETSVAEPAAEKPAEETPKDPGDEVVPEPAVPDAAPQFEPLEKVKDEIRDILAQQKAGEKLQAQFEELSGQMKRYADEHDIYSVEKQTNAKAIAPQPLDFNKLAEGKNVEVGELKSVTPLQAMKSDIGKSFREMQSAIPGQGRQVPFVQFAFAENLPEYRAEMDQDGENNFYLFWKTSEEPAYVPPLDEIRSEVVQAWKLNKARELAKKRGEEYAEQARTQKKSLAELFGSQPNMKVSEPAPFSWLTLGNVPLQQGAEPRLSEVDGVDQAGPDFMRAVFGLPAGGVGVAFNQPQDIVYVVRAIEFEPSEEQLRDEFARENPMRYLSAAREDQRAIYRSWIEDLKTDADVRWLRQADVRRTAAADEGEL
jgi:hypothetical protein